MAAVINQGATQSDGWLAICPLDELREDLGAVALVGERQVALFRLKGVDGVFAIDNHDPFSGANVLARGIVGDLRGQLVVASPIYKQHFNLETGACLEDRSIALDTFTTRISSDGQLELRAA